MKTITILYLHDCPYCHDARRALAALKAEQPSYAAIGEEWIEEERERGRAAAYRDYYYVPSIYFGKTKLYEAHPSENYAAIKAKVEGALRAVLAAP